MEIVMYELLLYLWKGWTFCLKKELCFHFKSLFMVDIHQVVTKLPIVLFFTWCSAIFLYIDAEILKDWFVFVYVLRQVTPYHFNFSRCLSKPCPFKFFTQNLLSALLNTLSHLLDSNIFSFEVTVIQPGAPIQNPIKHIRWSFLR